jgi:hypothetical protein
MSPKDESATMTLDTKEHAAYVLLKDRLQTILPQLYQESYEELQPTPMRSAGLKFDAEGRVAWGEIWGSFCDLAMAGGPPHKGRLLQPASLAETDADPKRYQQVVEEVHRGIALATGLVPEPAAPPGWVRINCFTSGMAGWLVRAITMENVSAYSEGSLLHLPVSPSFRLEKEIKNVITVLAKTHHYWTGHIPPRQQRLIGNLLARMEVDHPLLRPPTTSTGPAPENYESLARQIRVATNASSVEQQYSGWLGIACADVDIAIWITRALVASNVLSRREETTVFLPIDPEGDPAGEHLVAAFTRIHRFAAARRFDAVEGF